YEPAPVVLANQAVAIAMADGPQAGLAILDRIAAQGKLSRWPQLHIARAELLCMLGRGDDAAAAYHQALAAGLPAAEQDFIAGRLTELARHSAAAAVSRVEACPAVARARAARVVIVGAGFAGLTALGTLAGLRGWNPAARAGRARPRLMLVDRNTYSTFQPLLYQVATAGLTSSDVAYPAWTAVHKTR